MNNNLAPTFPEWKRREIVELARAGLFKTIGQLFGPEEAAKAKTMATRRRHGDPSSWTVLE